MEFTATGARTGGWTIFLVGILTITGQIGCERTTGIACVLVLHTGLIGNNCIARGVKSLAIQEGVKR